MCRLRLASSSQSPLTAMDTAPLLSDTGHGFVGWSYSSSIQIEGTLLILLSVFPQAESNILTFLR